MATASETFPTESHVPRSFVDYQLARSAQTRYALGSLHSDSALAAGTDLSRHFTRAPAQPTAWSSGQATVLPWREADTRLDMAARNVQRIYRGQARSYYEMAMQALRIQQREAAEFAEMMRAVSRERNEAPRGSEEGAAVLAALLAAAEAPPVLAERDPLVAKVRAEQREAQQSVLNHQASLKALADAPLVTDDDRAAAAEARDSRERAIYLGSKHEGAAKEAASKAVAAPVAAAPVAAAPVAPANAKPTATEAMAVREARRPEQTRPAPAAPVAVAVAAPGPGPGLLSGAAAQVAPVAAQGHATATATATATAPASAPVPPTAEAPAPAPAKHVPSMPQRRSTIEAQLQAAPLGSTGGSALGSELGGTASLPEEMRQLLSGVAPGRPVELPAGSGRSAEELQARCGEMYRGSSPPPPWVAHIGWHVL